MNPSHAKGKARRKPCTEKPSARFDEEREVVKISLLLYDVTLAGERLLISNLTGLICMKYGRTGV